MAWPKFERTEAHRRKIGDALRGRKRSPEQVEKNRLGHLGQKVSDETRQKLRDVDHPARFLAGRDVPKEICDKISKARAGRSATLRRYGVSDEEYKAKRLEGYRWCSNRKHWGQSELFTSKDAVCSECRPEFHRRHQLKRNFGVDAAWYEAKLAEQGGRCAICGTDKVSYGKQKHFCVDHSHGVAHASKRLRGLLCNRCNTSLERIDTVPNWAALATDYIVRYARIHAESGVV